MVGLTDDTCTRIKNEREPVVKAVIDLSNEFPDLNFQVLSVDPIL